jgi:hypothetical protein
MVPMETNYINPNTTISKILTQTLIQIQIQLQLLLLI